MSSPKRVPGIHRSVRSPWFGARLGLWVSCMCVLLCGLAGQGAGTAQGSSSPGVQQPSLFTGSDGDLDLSGFLSTRVGFLPVAMPITEPALGLGLGGGLAFFHDKLQVVTGADGQKRAMLPSITMVLGAATENGTWGAGLGHLGNWDGGNTRYMGAAGYGSLELDWYGKGDALKGRSVHYTNRVTLVEQRIKFRLGNSDFYLGPQYRFQSTDSKFDASSLNPGIPQLELHSETSGLGLALGYDSRDQPFSPTRGWLASLDYSQQTAWLGSDFTYGKLSVEAVGYTKLGEGLVLGGHFATELNTNDAPFYDLAMLNIRGIPLWRFVDDIALQLEAELRWDFARRWTAVGFAGVGRVSGSFSGLADADDQIAGGAGLRYLIAEDYGLRMGLDLAHGDDDTSVYVTIGTGWIRP